ncbi:glycine cleavage system aminomethyltransferase GcvT [Microbacterium aerolatum]|uniref:Aminomethyltransferase n=1 Tax=Microbacterium aerolatum TaxID=153731 RepID=A0A511ANF0_9MICO|nr:glycine cleavage system aminomethyltransferase GcvT [Microbacterium aerolatum]GEK87317.1 aminomethyltransferase [Microbacterium aerolatum]GGB13953.1 aminomethyltransferase [Microbacterium aerolatum]
MAEPRFTPLRERHESLGASFTDFGGWQMPVRYTSDLAEHHAVRQAAGLFDISHMAEFTVDGADAATYLDYALAGRLSTMSVGKAKYSLLLAETGGIIDDVIVYRLAEDRFLIISNAGNRDAVAAALPQRVGAFDVAVEDVSDSYALIAVQGPASEAIVSTIDGITQVGTPWAEQKYYAWTDALFSGQPLLIARTGYTGEDGFELLVRSDDAAALWDAALAAGTPHGLVPAGLAARDTLRLEAGMPLYGHELSLDTKPAQAGLGRVVASDKDDFVGKPGAAAADDARVLVGLTAEGKRAGRAGYGVVADDGTVLGEITSGALSPTLGHPIAMAYLDPAFAEAGTTVNLDVRGTKIPATVTALPFYRRKK